MARVKAPILTGETIGKWVVGAMLYHPVRKERMYECVCDCGTVKVVKHIHLINGKTKSCGCSWTTHGMARTKEYITWDSMVRRCHSESHHAYSNYGGRGISVCDKWQKFQGFYEDMGNKPKGLTLERINNSLGYNKDNCKWASMTEQSRNRRTTKLDEEDAKLIKSMIGVGITQNVIASQFGVSSSNIGHIAQNSTWRTI